MDFINEEYFLNQKTNLIYKESIISRRKIKELKEEEIIELINHEDVQLCVHHERDKINWIEKTKNSAMLKEITNHINTSDSEKGLNEFENGYCYFAELWKMKGGEKLILLHYHH